MCGVAGVHRVGDASVPRLNRLARKLLLAIEGRGGDATGMLALADDGSYLLAKKAQSASRYLKKAPTLPADARTVLLHTRLATVGSRNDPRNAHPLVSGTVAAAHNGTIANADEIFAAFRLPRTAKVDSEVIPALVYAAGWDKIADALSLMQGGAALAMVNTQQPREVVLARTRGFPLVFFRTSRVVVWASTRQAIERAWRQTYGHLTPPKGEWSNLREGELVRINGRVERERFPLAALSRPHVRPARVKTLPAAVPQHPIQTKSPATLAMEALEATPVPRRQEALEIVNEVRQALWDGRAARAHDLLDELAAALTADTAYQPERMSATSAAVQQLGARALPGRRVGVGVAGAFDPEDGREGAEELPGGGRRRGGHRLRHDPRWSPGLYATRGASSA